MQVNFYTRSDIQACGKVRRALDRLQSEYGLQITEKAINPAVRTASGVAANAPAIEIEGSKLGVLDSGRGAPDEKTIRAYLELAKATGAAHGPAARPGSLIPVEQSLPATEKPVTKLSAVEHPVKAYMWKHRVAFVISALSAFLGLAWVAPLLDSLGAHDVAHAIFNAYRWVCIQTPERSPFVAGHQCCLCWRCVGIYGGSLLFGIIYVFGRDLEISRLRWLTRPVALKGLILFSVPMIADGLSHTFGLRPGIDLAHSSSFWVGWGEFQLDWWLRIITALIATVGAVKFLCPRLDRAALAYENSLQPHLKPRLAA